MRILHFMPSLDAGVGGPARAVVDLCTALALRGHAVTLLTSDPARASQSWQGNGGSVPQLVTLPRARLPACTHVGAALRQLASLIPRQDLVHVHGVWEFANIQISTIAANHDVPYVISPRGMLDDWCLAQRAWKKRAYLKACGQQWLRGAARIHLTADAELEQSSKWFPHERGEVIPNLLDLSPYRDLPNAATIGQRLRETLGDRPRLLFLSRIHEKKGLDVLIRACGLLKRQGRAAALVVAGDGEPKYVAALQSLARAENLGAQDIAFLGMVTGPEKLALYQACDLFAMPTQQENFGFVFVEALSCGLPIVTTADIDLWKEFASSGATVIAARSPEAFAAAIADLLNSPARLKHMGAMGRGWALDAFDTAKTLDRFENMYRQAQSRPT